MLFTTVTIAALFASSEAKIGHRQLSFEKFHTFTPLSQVTDHAAIDLDQKEIDTLLSGEEIQWLAAQSVYELGAHSKSYAELTLSEKLETSLAVDTQVEGVAIDGTTKVSGRVMDAAASGDATITVQYHTLDNMATYVSCQVGGSSAPVTTGCLAESGSITISGKTIAYTAVANKNGRTIKGFSKNDEKHHVDSNPDQDYYADMAMFVEYYGSSDYGDKWVTAALSGTSTSFTSGRGDADFSVLDDEGRVETVVKGTSFLNIFMYVIRELEDAIDDCKRGCDDDSCNDDPVQALDEAVAFYTGSLHITEGDAGTLLYSLAQKRCENFGTCVDGVAAVNNKIFVLFNRMQNLLRQEKCDEAAKVKSEIVDHMYVPMIQGALRYAYKSGALDDQTDKSEAEGASFAAAVLPKVHKCNPTDAQTIYDQMKIGNAEAVDWPAVKRAFEKNYGCMKVNCAEIGGLTDGELYYEGAEPCSASFMVTAGLALGVTVASIMAFF